MVRGLYIDQLASNWVEDSATESTRIGVDKKIDGFVHGDIEHAAGVLSALWEIVSKDGDIKTPSSILPAAPLFPDRRHKSTTPVVSRSRYWLLPLFAGVFILRNRVGQVSPAHWASVKIALIKSIRRGTLFDRKYWARHRRTGDVSKPIYFSSIVMGDKVQELKSRTSKSGYGFTEALSVSSGQIPQGSKRPYE